MEGGINCPHPAIFGMSVPNSQAQIFRASLPRTSFGFIWTQIYSTWLRLSGWPIFSVLVSGFGSINPTAENLCPLSLHSIGDLQSM
jgi:hypothetical protein